MPFVSNAKVSLVSLAKMIPCVLIIMSGVEAHHPLKPQDDLPPDRQYTAVGKAKREELKRGLACISGEILTEGIGGKLFVSMYLRDGFALDHPGEPEELLAFMNIHSEQLELSNLKLVSTARVMRPSGLVVTRHAGLVEIEADVRLTGPIEKEYFSASFRNLTISSTDSSICFSKPFAIHWRKI